jgi:acetoin utilization protein AcuC
VSQVLIYSPDVLRYDFGPTHPLRPERYSLTHDLMRSYGLFDRAIEVVAPVEAHRKELERVHSSAYIDAVTAAGEDPRKEMLCVGIGISDNPPFPDMHQVSSIVAGGSIDAAAMVLAGQAEYAFNMAGGLHHALRDRASGFCVYNDPAIAIAWLLEQGVSRVAYLDTDAHHGDGVQWIFYYDPRVLTVSIHESGRYLFPGTGDVDEIGSGQARGTSINVPLAPYASDADVLAAMDEVAIPVIEAFRPEFLVLQHGCDPHAADPLTHLNCSLSVFREIGLRERQLALRACPGRAIGGGGGGYAYREIVPRAWLLTFAALTGLELDPRLPEDWRQATGIGAALIDEDGVKPPPLLANTTQTIRDLYLALGKSPL